MTDLTAKELSIIESISNCLPVCIEDFPESRDPEWQKAFIAEAPMIISYCIQQYREHVARTGSTFIPPDIRGIDTMLLNEAKKAKKRRQRAKAAKKAVAV